ncbi:hypothetical protein PFISCL1PPCAC_12242, partial [Pristionchus fissidentatus]
NTAAIKHVEALLDKITSKSTTFERNCVIREWKSKEMDEETARQIVGSLYERAVRNHDLCQFYAYLCAGKVRHYSFFKYEAKGFLSELLRLTLRMFDEEPNCLETRDTREKSRRLCNIALV